MLDTATLATATFLTVFMAASILAHGRLTGRTGIQSTLWVLGFLGLGLGILLQSTQGNWPPPLSILCANLSFGLGSHAFWAAARRINGKPPSSWRPPFVLIGALLAAHALIGLDAGGFVARTVLMSALMAIYSFIIARELAWQEGLRPATLFPTLLFAITGLALALRAISSPLLPVPANVVAASPFNQATFLLAIVFNTLIAASLFPLLAGRRPDNPATGLPIMDGPVGPEILRAWAEHVLDRHLGARPALLLLEPEPGYARMGPGADLGELVWQATGRSALAGQIDATRFLALLPRSDLAPSMERLEGLLAAHAIPAHVSGLAEPGDVRSLAAWIQAATP